MGVSDEVRKVESEIDAYFRGLPCWNAPRDDLLRSILDWYRDIAEAVCMMMAQAVETDQADQVSDALNLEQIVHGGVLQLLKWAGTLGRSDGGDGTILAKDEDWLALALDAQLYVNLVDALRMAKHDLHGLRLRVADRVLEVYEGGNQTGHDGALVERQQATNPFHLHAVFTKDSDQLTTGWSAGDYRRVAAWIVQAAEVAETETVVSTLHGERGKLKPPRVFEVPEFLLDDDKLLNDLSVPSSTLTGAAIWTWDSWMDSPLVVVGGKRLGVSNHVKAALGRAVEMHMLRLAARVDPDQYTKVSQLREGRMIAHGQCVLEDAGWRVTPNYLFTDPKAELDLLAERGDDTLLIELKSTLRPESPWEVYKRNRDLIKGIGQVRALVPRIPGAAVGVVLTDGYRGDHDTWAEALSAGVPTGTLDDLPLVAESPHDVFDRLAKEAGINAGGPAGSPVETREFQLAGWTIRLIDAEVPSEFSKEVS